MALELYEGRNLMALTLCNLERARPLTAVVDIGAGSGSHARLMRELLPQTPWSAVEIWGPEVESACLNGLYDSVYIADVQCLDLTLIPDGGVALLGEVLDRMSLPQAVAVVNRLLTRMEYVLISLPLGEWHATVWAERPFNHRVHLWTPDELHAIPGGVHVVLLGHPALAIMICARSPAGQELARAAMQAAHAELAACERLLTDEGRFRDYEDTGLLLTLQTRLTTLPSIQEWRVKRAMQGWQEQPEARETHSTFLLERFNDAVARSAWHEAARVIDFLATVCYPNSQPVLEMALRVNGILNRPDQVDRFGSTLLSLNPQHHEAHVALVTREVHFSEAEIDAKVTQAASDPQTVSECVLHLQNLYHAISALILFADISPERTGQLQNLLHAGRQYDGYLLEGLDPAMLKTNHRFKELLVAMDLEVVLDPQPPVIPWPNLLWVDGDGQEVPLATWRARAAQHGVELLFLAAMDEKYFTKYAKVYVEGLLAKSDMNGWIVLCIIGGGERLCSLVRSLGIRDERLMVCGHDPQPPIVDYRYYGCMRFVLLETLLDTFAVPVLCTDVDLILTRGIREMLDRCAGFDVVFNENRATMTIADRFVANMTLFHPTPLAKRMAAFLRLYIVRVMSRGLVSDFIDQVALTLARWHLLRHAQPRLGRFHHFDINNYMFTSGNMEQFRTLSREYRFLSLYANNEAISETTQWWLEPS
ncbi:MAG: hypothetical protein G8237_10270 [Magnetococcales bacterium]|nr:hypothetical protein [Magnetococcales bacterium]NGZ06730.1 hypothetical protein [Magnetococcales bacterium]